MTEFVTEPLQLIQQEHSEPIKDITVYTIDYILDFGNTYTGKVSASFIETFSEIKKINRFSPKNFSKSFNYTNWKTAVSKEEEAERNEEDIIIQKIIGTLNKLSESNFEKLKHKLWEFVDFKESRIKVLIDNIFSMAIVQTIFCQNYAKLCVFIKEQIDKTYEDPEITQTLSQINIKYIILEKCQQLFIHQNDLEDVDSSEYDKFCDIMKQKKQFTGSFQLVGELYLVDMIVEETIWKYFQLLFKNLESKETELIEQYTPCLKSFITTIGQKLANTASPTKRDELVGKITLYSKNTDIFSCKGRFILMDILDFINDGWTK